LFSPALRFSNLQGSQEFKEGFFILRRKLLEMEPDPERFGAVMQNRVTERDGGFSQRWATKGRLRNLQPATVFLQ
jgi:hypothetical protein